MAKSQGINLKLLEILSLFAPVGYRLTTPIILGTGSNKKELPIGDYSLLGLYMSDPKYIKIGGYDGNIFNWGEITMPKLEKFLRTGVIIPLANDPYH